MLSANALERASSAYRRGYHMGALGEPAIDCTGAAPGTFAAHDFAQGHAAGMNDARPMREAQAKKQNARLVDALVINYRKETIKAQRVAADLSARARSYLGALCVYHPSQVPSRYRALAAAQQKRAAVAYGKARDWHFLLDSINDGATA